MNALTLAIRLVKLGFIPAEHFIGNGNDVVMTESGARALGIYSQFYFHMTSANGQDNDPAPTTRTLEEEIGYAEKGARIMDSVSGEACKMTLDHGRSIHDALEPREADVQLLGRVRELTKKHDLKVLVPDAPTPEPITEQIYSTKHLEQPGATHPDREVDLLIGTQRDSLLTSDVRTDRQVVHLRQGVGKARPINTTKAGTVLARSLVGNPFDTIMTRPRNIEDYLQPGLNPAPHLKGSIADFDGDTGVTLPPMFPPGFGDMVRKACRNLANFFTAYFQRVWAMDKFGEAMKAEGGFEAFWRKRYPERAFLLKGLRRSQRERFLAKELSIYFNAHWQEYRRDA